MYRQTRSGDSVDRSEIEVDENERETTVLFADTPKYLEYVVSEVDNLPFDVCTTDDLTRVREILSSDDVDCLVLDSDMSGDVRENQIAKICDQYSTVPIILWTELVNQSTIQEMSLIENVTYVPKIEASDLHGPILTNIERRLHKQTNIESVIEQIDGLVCHCNTDLEITRVDDDLLSIYGLSQQDVIGQDVISVFSEYVSPNSASLIHTAEKEQSLIRADVQSELADVEFDMVIQPSQFKLSIYLFNQTSKPDHTLESGEDIDGSQRIDPIENDPDPRIILDTSDGTILRSNQPAEYLFELSGDEVAPSSFLLPYENDRAQYEQLLDEIKESGGGTYDTYPNESPIALKTVNSESVPFEIISQVNEGSDEQSISIVFRPIQTRARYQNKVKQINQLFADINYSNVVSKQDAAKLVGDAIIDRFECVGLAIYLFDPNSSTLLPVYTSGEITEDIGEAPVFKPGDSIAWDVFSTGQIAKFDDVRSSNMIHNPDTVIRSEIIVPIGNHGILMIPDKEVGVFDEIDIDVASILADAVVLALNNAETLQKKKESDENLFRKRKQLDYVEQLNSRLRSINEILVTEKSPERIKSKVCEVLTQLEGFQSVWIGSPDRDDNEILITASENMLFDNAKALDLSLNDSNEFPPVKCYLQRETIHVENVARGFGAYDWRSEFLKQGYRSIVSIPIIYDGIFYDILTINSGTADTFGPLTIDILNELSDLIGYTLNSIDQRNALVGETSIEFSVSVHGIDDVFSHIASEYDTRITIWSTLPKSRGKHDLEQTETDSYIVHFTTPNGRSEVDLSGVENIDHVRSFRTIPGEMSVHEIVVSAEGFDSRYLGHASRVMRTEIENGCVTFNVSAPMDRTKNEYIEQIKEHFEGFEVQVDQLDSSTNPIPWVSVLGDSLTERQLQFLRTSYQLGYFDSPRKMKGVEMAEFFDVSQPVYSVQIRNSLSNLLSLIWGESV